MDNYKQIPQVSSKKFYQKSLFIVLLLVFFFPIGLFLMWKYAHWSRKLKIIVTVGVVIVAIYGFAHQGETASNENLITPEMTHDVTKETSDATPSTTTTKEAKNEIKLVDGYDKLQSLFLEIDENYTKDQIIKVAEDNGLNVKTAYIMADMQLVYVSTSAGTLGDGAEEWYQFETDSIEITLFEDNKNDDSDLYAFSKTYVVRNKMMSVEESFHSSEISTKNQIDGYSNRRKTYEYKDDWKDIKEALNYCLNHD